VRKIRVKFCNMTFRNYSISLIVIVCLAGLIASCSSTKQINDSSKAFELEQYHIAVELLKGEFKNAADGVVKAEKAFMLAESYRKMNNVVEAAVWYQQAVDLNYKPIAKWWLGHMLKGQENYEKAKEIFKSFAMSDPASSSKAEIEIEACDNAIKWKGWKTKYRIERMDVVNSEKSDYSPYIGENKSLVFSSDRKDAVGKENYPWTGDNFSDLFVSEKDENDNYTEPVLFDDKEIINTEDNEGTVTFNKEFTEIYFTRCTSEDEEAPGDYCKIHVSYRNDDGTWGDPEVVALFEDSFEVGHPALSADGNQMVFASNGPGSHGGKDLYVTNRTSDGWGTPKNLGPDINTEGDEMFPFLHPDGDLYFASNGLPGMGMLDMYYATKETALTWVKPLNLLAPINSGADDFGIFYDEYNILNQSGFYESVGYFCTSRPGGRGKDDIYKFTVVKPAYFALDGLVLKKILEDRSDPGSAVLDLSPIPNCKISLMKYDNATGVGETVESMLSDEDGVFNFILEPETEYKVTAEPTEGDFFTKSEFVTTKGIIGSKNLAITLTIEVVLDTMIPETQIVLKNIYYDYDDWKILKEAAKVLDTLAFLLKDNPTIKVEIGSHTDSRGSFAYNEKLSSRRASVVVKYLISRNIARTRLAAKGYGESTLVNNCDDSRMETCSEQLHAQNRRTTFKVLSKDRVIVSNPLDPSEIYTKFRESSDDRGEKPEN